MSRRNFINKSYKDKLRATYTLLIFLVLVSLSFFIYSGINNKVKPIIGDIGLHVIDSEAQYFGQRFHNQSNILELLSHTQAFKIGDFYGIKKEIDNQMLRYGDSLLSIKFIGVDGNEYENNPSKIIINDTYTKELLATDKGEFLPQTIYSDKLSGYISSAGTKVTGDNGKMLGILIIKVEVKKLILSVDKTRVNQLGEMWIFDSQGNVILDPTKNEVKIYDVESLKKQILNKTSGEVKINNSKGNSSYLIYSLIPNTDGLYLAMGVDHKDFSNAMKFLLLVVISGVSLACIFIFVFANKISNFVTKPLTRMVEIIQNSDDTNFIEIPMDLKTSKDEIGVLANTIDEMARNIRNNVNTLNSEIKDRKKAEANLLVLNNDLEGRVSDRTLALTNVTNSLSVSEERFRVALDAADIGLYDLDSINKELVVNGVFLKLINAVEYTQGLIKESDWVQYNKKLTDVIYPDDQSRLILLEENKLQGMLEDFYAEFRLKEDCNIWLSLTGKEVKKDENGKFTRFIGVLQNISERKKAEDELKTAKEEAEEASLSKSQFLANMSHEIRTPMNAIMGLNHLISQSNLNDIQTKYVSKIQESSTTLLRIINDILDFSKMEAGKMEIEHIKFNLDKILENISNLYAMSATNKGIHINFDKGLDVPDILVGDPLRLEQIICNLTTNAIKFTKHGEVNVTVRVLSETENNIKLHFIVTDTGIGLTNEEIERLFEAFTQADGSMTRKYGGTGLGLAISKQLVELMDGKIWAESKYGEGSSFQFTIEFKKSIDKLKAKRFDCHNLKGKKVLDNKDENDEGDKKYNSILNNKNILLVEDNEINQLVAKDILEGAGIHVSIAINGIEAIKCVRENRFDAVLMDVQMPIMDGYEATAILRETYSNLQLPIIAMTANAMTGDLEKSISTGMNDYISKPINPDILFETLVQWLNGKSIETTKKTVVNQSSNKETKILDFENTLIRLGNKQEFYATLLKIYSKNYCNLVYKLSNLISNKKDDEVKRFIHTLKSVTANIGATKFNEFIIEFEKKYESYDDIVIIRELKVFSSLNEELLNSINKFISIDKSEGKTLSAGLDFYSALERLVITLSTARAKEIKESMNNLVLTDYGLELIAQIDVIKELVDSYHFKEAKVATEKLIDSQRGKNNG